VAAGSLALPCARVSGSGFPGALAARIIGVAAGPDPVARLRRSTPCRIGLIRAPQL